MADRTSHFLSDIDIDERYDPAFGLGAVRAVVHGLFLLVVFRDSFGALGQLPVTLFRPAGVMEYFSWKFYDRLITPGGMVTLKLMLLLSLLMSTLGWWTSRTAKSSLLLVLLYEGIRRGFGHNNPYQMAALFMLLVLAFTPSGDGFSLDSLCGRPIRRPAVAYRYPVRLCQMILAWMYLSTAIFKLRTSGWEYFSSDSILPLFLGRSLGNLHVSNHHLALNLVAWRHAVPWLVGLGIAWELLFPVGAFWRPTRRWYLAAGGLYHLALQFLLNVSFLAPVWMLAVFLDWRNLGRRLRRLPLLSSLAAWWDSFSGPEFFPEARYPEPIGAGRGLLLWDGNCGFCRRMADLLKKIALKPVEMRPFQEVLPQLPAEILPWTNSQMHWVRPDGVIVGGSQALIETLEAADHKLTSGLLESPLFRPIIWFGYKLVAQNRGTAGSVMGTTCENPPKQ